MRGIVPPVPSAASRSSPAAEAKAEDDTKAEPRQGRRGLEAEANISNATRVVVAAKAEAKADARDHDRRQGRRALAMPLTATQHSG